MLFFGQFFLCILMGSECGWGLGEGQTFSLVEGLKIEFKAFSGRGSSLIQTQLPQCSGSPTPLTHMHE